MSTQDKKKILKIKIFSCRRQRRMKMNTSLLKMSANQSAVENVHAFMNEALSARSAQETSKSVTPTPKKKDQIKFPPIKTLAETPRAKPDPKPTKPASDSAATNSPSNSPSNSASSSFSKPVPNSMKISNSVSYQSEKSKSEPIPVSDSDSESEENHVQESDDNDDQIYPPENWTYTRQYVRSKNVFSDDDDDVPAPPPPPPPPPPPAPALAPEISKYDELCKEIADLKDTIKKLEAENKNLGTQLWNFSKDIGDINTDIGNMLGAHGDFHKTLKEIKKAREELGDIRNLDQDLHLIKERQRELKKELEEKQETRNIMDQGLIGKVILARCDWFRLKTNYHFCQTEKQKEYTIRRNVWSLNRLLNAFLEQEVADSLTDALLDDPLNITAASDKIEKTIAGALKEFEERFDEGEHPLKAAPKKEPKKEPKKQSRKDSKKDPKKEH